MNSLSKSLEDVREFEKGSICCGFFESETLEFKMFADIAVQGWSNASDQSILNYKSILHTICAFLNTKGGRIYVGIEDKSKEVLGVSEEFVDVFFNILAHITTSDIFPSIDQGYVYAFPIPIKNSYRRYVIKVLVRQGERTQIYSTSSTMHSYYWRSFASNKTYSPQKLLAEMKSRSIGTLMTEEISFSESEMELKPELKQKKVHQSILEVVSAKEDKKVDIVPPGKSQSKDDEEKIQEEKITEIVKEKIPEDENQSRDIANKEKQVIPESKNEHSQVPKNLQRELNEEIKENKDIEEVIIEKKDPKEDGLDNSDESELKPYLPIQDYKEAIKNMVSKNNVVVIKGHTGSGKTTQIPQYLMELPEIEGRIALCQPYKHALESIANRISSEINSPVECIYAESLSNFKAEGSKIFLISHEAMLFALLSSPELKEISCIIIDEAHERDEHTDLLISFIIYFVSMKINPKLKVIFSSATINIKETLEKLLATEIQELVVKGRQYKINSHWYLTQFEGGKNELENEVSKGIVLKIDENNILEEGEEEKDEEEEGRIFFQI